jgi:hypothetical protein
MVEAFSFSQCGNILNDAEGSLQLMEQKVSPKVSIPPLRLKPWEALVPLLERLN